MLFPSAFTLPKGHCKERSHESGPIKTSPPTPHIKSTEISPDYLQSLNC